MTQELIAQALELAPRKMLVGGKWLRAQHGGTIPVANPATGEVFATVEEADMADAMAALDGAAKAAPGWAAKPPRRRGDLLLRAHDLIVAHERELAALITLVMGKPLADALGEVRYGAAFFRWYAQEAVRIYGRTAVAPEGHLDILTVPRPVGPCLFITPWNFPLAMATRKLG
ncbi:MAG: aldehyde dehydrogenase family protein, partial [Bifidobacteriaceae bacterium]|nr:aldehyde dehydrogenase family protein [Bifidobacteriaceae bacterium]